MDSIFINFLITFFINFVWLFKLYPKIINIEYYRKNYNYNDNIFTNFFSNNVFSNLNNTNWIIFNKEYFYKNSKYSIIFNSFSNFTFSRINNWKLIILKRKDKYIDDLDKIKLYNYNLNKSIENLVNFNKNNKIEYFLKNDIKWNIKINNLILNNKTSLNDNKLLIKNKIKIFNLKIKKKDNYIINENFYIYSFKIEYYIKFYFIFYSIYFLIEFINKFYFYYKIHTKQIDSNSISLLSYSLISISSILNLLISFYFLLKLFKLVYLMIFFFINYLFNYFCYDIPILFKIFRNQNILTDIFSNQFDRLMFKNITKYTIWICFILYMIIKFNFLIEFQILLNIPFLCQIYFFHNYNNFIKFDINKLLIYFLFLLNLSYVRTFINPFQFKTNNLYFIINLTIFSLLTIYYYLQSIYGPNFIKKNSLYNFLIKKSKEILTEEIDCLICFKKIKKKNKLIKLNDYNKELYFYKLKYVNIKKFIKLNCNHVFHSICIINWLKIKKECPLCKFTIKILI